MVSGPNEFSIDQRPKRKLTPKGETVNAVPALTPSASSTFAMAMSYCILEKDATKALAFLT